MSEAPSVTQHNQASNQAPFISQARMKYLPNNRCRVQIVYSGGENSELDMTFKGLVEFEKKYRIAIPRPRGQGGASVPASSQRVGITTTKSPTYHQSNFRQGTITGPSQPTYPPQQSSSSIQTLSARDIVPGHDNGCRTSGQDMSKSSQNRKRKLSHIEPKRYQASMKQPKVANGGKTEERAGYNLVSSPSSELPTLNVAGHLKIQTELGIAAPELPTSPEQLHELNARILSSFTPAQLLAEYSAREIVYLFDGDQIDDKFPHVWQVLLYRRLIVEFVRSGEAPHGGEAETWELAIRWAKRDPSEAVHSAVEGVGK